VEEVRSFVENVAAVPQVSALLLGESGTGKNLVARAIHGAGSGATARFVEINCALLPANLLEAELFGYEKGAFTDAKQAKKGLVEVADGGTLFLDELGTIVPEVQAKLLTFLESRTFRRVGSTTEMSVNLRVIAATNVALAEEVARGSFREDLYYRLNVASHTLPPLRLIKSDLPELARHFAQRAAQYFAKPVPSIDSEGNQRLKGYDWPGNVRELRNVIERSMIFSKDSVLQIGELRSPSAAPTTGLASGADIPLGLTLEEVERRYIDATLQEVGENVAEAAKRLGISRKVLWQRRKRHGLLADSA
jgi:transcriptional regulator with PAS, ATPase and Fis domain